MGNTPLQIEQVEGMMEALSTSAGLAVTYCRGESSAEVTAVIGRTQVESSAGDGTLVLSQVRDFIIKAAELVLEIDGEPTQVDPVEGDTIQETRGGVVRTYQVFDVGGEVFRWLGHFDTYIRIHAKQISVGPEAEPEEGGEG